MFCVWDTTKVWEKETNLWCFSGLKRKGERCDETEALLGGLGHREDEDDNFSGISVSFDFFLNRLMIRWWWMFSETTLCLLFWFELMLNIFCWLCWWWMFSETTLASECLNIDCLMMMLFWKLCFWIVYCFWISLVSFGCWCLMMMNLFVLCFG